MPATKTRISEAHLPAAGRDKRDQAQRGRNTSKLLNYLDPSIAVSVGDLLGVRSLKETYFGFGASHRSGIFDSSQLLGNINGGSNYTYTYIYTYIYTYTHIYIESRI